MLQKLCSSQELRPETKKKLPHLLCWTEYSVAPEDTIVLLCVYTYIQTP